MSASIQQRHYRNGQLREKIPLRQGRRHGVARTWHPNGQLASEETFRNGVLHGRCRQWNVSGKLLGEFVMDHGTGVQREWHDNGRLKIEVSTVNGEFTGRNRLWLRDGTLWSERFYLRDRLVTPTQYLKLTARDQSLPRYADKPARLPKKSRATQRHLHEVWVQGSLERSDVKEAREWFRAGCEAKRSRSLGRFRSERSASAFVESLYAAGAVAVIVPGVYGGKRNSEFADALLVQLPKTSAVRRRIRAACAILRRQRLGAVAPERDLGESHLFLSMS